MGRELKRVPLDFKWPINQLWKGFVNPYHSMECSACKGSGLNPATKKLSDDWYTHLRTDGQKGWSKNLSEIEVEALAKSGRLRDILGRNISFDKDLQRWGEYKDGERVEVDAPEMPTPEVVNEHFSKGFGHDGINQWVCVKARAKHEGIFGNCEYCDDGVIWESDAVKQQHDDWQNYEPPTGEGYQLWSTTTEGHPMSPVFATLKALCKHLADNKVSVFGSKTWTEEEWMQSLDSGHVYYKEGNAIFI